MKYTIQFLLISLFTANTFAQEYKVILDKKITPNKKTWTLCKTIKASAGMRFNVKAQVVNVKKDFEFCITAFPGNQIIYTNYEAQSVDYSFEAPANCQYAILGRGKREFRVTVQQKSSPEQETKADAESYMMVNVPDTTWKLAVIDSVIGYATKIVPMTKKVMYQTKEATEVIFNQSFALEPGRKNIASVELPFLLYDDYQKIKVTKLNHTLTVSDATYDALKSKVSSALASGITMGVGKAARKKIGKLSEHDESWKTVDNLMKKMDKVEPYKEVITSGYDFTDIAINGTKPEEEEEEKITVETYMFEGNSLNKKVLEATKVKGVVQDFVPKDILNFKVPGIGDVANEAAGLIVPKIKDKVEYKVVGQKDTVLMKGTSGFKSFSIPYDEKVTGDTYFFHIKNPRSKKDIKNLLTSYMYGSLMVEMTYTVDTYKDVLYFGEVRTPIRGKRLINKPTVTYRTELIRKSDMKPWYVVATKQFVPGPKYN